MFQVFRKYLVHKNYKNNFCLAISAPLLNFDLKTRHLLHIRPLLIRLHASFYFAVGFVSVQRARSSAVEHFVDIEGVTGSIPVVPTM